MALDTSLNGLRAQIVTSIYGRRDGLDANEFNVGPKDIRLQVEGVSSAGSTIVSTSVATPLSNYGVSLVGASGASATTGYTLSTPLPGVYKTFICPTTGYAVISATTIATGVGTAGAFIASTGSVASTHQVITMSGKGCSVQLVGLTTALWASVTQQYSSVSTNVAFS